MVFGNVWKGVFGLARLPVAGTNFSLLEMKHSAVSRLFSIRCVKRQWLDLLLVAKKMPARDTCVSWGNNPGHFRAEGNFHLVAMLGPQKDRQGRTEVGLWHC